MSTSIDLEINKPNRWHMVTGTIVLVLGYFAVIIGIAWLRR
jgi:hypothetical protein